MLNGHMRNTLINLDVQLVSETCYKCSVVFAMPTDLKQRCLDSRGTSNVREFFCPNGHGQIYTGKSDADKQRERAERLERTVAARDSDLRFEQRRLTNERRSHAATKGQLTKTRKRAEKGVCPEPSCKRSFVNVARHVAHQHPDFHA